jgi:patatin-like phospholipase/acyl hydrolase
MRILSICGGGARGLLSLSVLARIEETAGKPIGQLFDLIVGSSVGGIIALMLTRPKPLTALGTQGIFQSLVKEVFTKKAWPTLISLGGFVGPKYDGTVLREYLDEYLPEPFSAYNPVAVTTYDTYTPAPTIISSWNPSGLTPSHAGLATSAAPTYFPPLDGRWIDGGTVANNPSVVSILAAREAFSDDKHDILSIGTGITPKSFTAGPWGQAEWISKILDVMLDGEAALQHMLAPTFASKYLRIQPQLPHDIAMDDSSDATVVQLESLGREAYATHKADLAAFFAPDAGLSS